MSKISTLPSLGEAEIASYSDYLPIVDSSTQTTKKVTVAALNGYTANSSPTVILTKGDGTNNTITSDYNAMLRARVLSGRLVYCEAEIDNGQTGIPLTITPAATSENFLTLPPSLFAMIPAMFEVLTVSEVPPTASYSVPALIPFSSSATGVSGGERVRIIRFQGVWNDSTTWISSITKIGTTGNVKGVKLRFLALLKADKTLPYSS